MLAFIALRSRCERGVERVSHDSFDKWETSWALVARYTFNSIILSYYHLFLIMFHSVRNNRGTKLWAISLLTQKKSKAC